MPNCQLIAAVGTPLTPQESLNSSAFAAQLDRLWSSGIHGIFAAGTMGVGPLLADDTYRDLVEQAVDLSRGRGKLMLGASDLSLVRTQHRIDLLNRFEIDGVVVLPPFFMSYSQEELIAYYHALANESRSPLYLYDLPQRTHAKIEASTILTLAEHPNIVGIKCSGDIQQAQTLINVMAQSETKFHVIVAQPNSLRQLVGVGVTQHLDGIYALAPKWALGIIEHAVNGNDEAASHLQANITALLKTMRNHGGLSALTVLMNAVGVPGRFAPRPFRQLTTAQQRTLLEEPVVQQFLDTEISSQRTNKIDRAETNGSTRKLHVRDSIVNHNKT